MGVTIGQAMFTSSTRFPRIPWYNIKASVTTPAETPVLLQAVLHASSQTGHPKMNEAQQACQLPAQLREPHCDPSTSNNRA
jgi:hypothetical protein